MIAGAVDLEAVDGHRGHDGRGDLPRQHRDEDRAQHLDQRAAAQQARVAGDHQEVERVGGDEDAEDRDRVAALVEVGLLERVQREPAEQRERRVRQQVVEQVGAAHAPARGVHQRRGEAERRGGRGAEQRHRQHEAGERPADPEALGVQDEDVRAEHEQREQAGERQRRPLVLVRDAAPSRPARRPGATPWLIAIDRLRPAKGTPPLGARVRAGAGASAPAAALTTESDHMTSPNQTTSAIQTITGSNLVRTPVPAQSGPGLS